ncbi:MAG TPA: endonuclease III [Clostridium sp.]|nr:endonuclease III [Clostridium sp.]
MRIKKTTREILDILYEIHPDAHCELEHENPFQLLVATVLSAQTTDKKVNEVTRKLFKIYKSPQDFATLDYGELEQEIKEIGLYRNKAKNIINLSRLLLENFNGEVPRSHEDLMTLPGVGRKTANVVLSNAYGIPALAVDTHVFRVSNRLGLATASKVEETEKQLTKAIPKDEWIIAHHTLIFHGRRICKAQRPNCGECALASKCKDYMERNRKK